MKYLHVIPRDLFNEAKLLKCLGQVALLIHDGKGAKGLRFSQFDDYQFEIHQRLEDGGLFCPSLPLYLSRNHEIVIYSAYNSKEPYPLLCMTHDEEEIRVLTHQGEFTDEFREYLRIIE